VINENDRIRAKTAGSKINKRKKKINKKEMSCQKNKSIIKG
jgi:hypothetical protein